MARLNRKQRLLRNQKSQFHRTGACKMVKAHNAAKVAENARTDAPVRSETRCTNDPDAFAMVIHGFQAVRKLSNEFTHKDGTPDFKYQQARPKVAKPKRFAKPAKVTTPETPINGQHYSDLRAGEGDRLFA